MNTKTDAQRNAEAKAAHIEGLIAALGMDFDRLDELRDAKAAHPKFIAGYNLAGYMPDAEPGECDSFDHAKRALIEDMLRAADEADSETVAEDLTAAAEDVNLWSERDESHSVTVHGVAYWITTNPEAFEDQEELNDLEALVAAADLDPSQCTEDGLSEAIHELPLEVSFRSGWQSLGEEPEAREVRVLLTYGGPSCEIRADWDANRGCSSPRILWAEMGAHGELYDFDHAAVEHFVNYLCGV